MLLLVVFGCRSEDPPKDTGTEIGDVAAMAAAWCDVLACRDGFYDAFDTIEECAGFYTDYWGNPDWDNNQRECFEDIEAVDACTVALQTTECGGETPEACVEFMICDDPDDTGSPGDTAG